MKSNRTCHVNNDFSPGAKEEPVLKLPDHAVCSLRTVLCPVLCCFDCQEGPTALERGSLGKIVLCPLNQAAIQTGNVPCCQRHSFELSY